MKFYIALSLGALRGPGGARWQGLPHRAATGMFLGPVPASAAGSAPVRLGI